MIPRNLAPTLLEVASYYPVVAVTGPRQSGKTTLCREAFPALPYVSLEPLDVRDYARRDPRAFLAEYCSGAVIDEVQNVPELFSYLQAEVDREPRPGRFVLTGSQHFALAQGLSDSLAGRVGILTLLPLAYDEIGRFPNHPNTLWEAAVEGGYPRIRDRGIPPERFLADYVATYIQRDVRQVLQVVDLQAFTTFVRLCAGRSGQELNLSALGADAGVTHNTARAWLSVLEASHLCFRLPAWHTNLRKQLIKAPKLHFADSGLMCHLLGVRDADQLRHHPLRGAVFETWVAGEILKWRTNRGLPANLYHYREARGLEVDLLIEIGEQLLAVEAKSGATIAADWLAPLRQFAEQMAKGSRPRQVEARVVFGGDAGQARSNAALVAWRDVAGLQW